MISFKVKQGRCDHTIIRNKKKSRKKTKWRTLSSDKNEINNVQDQVHHRALKGMFFLPKYKRDLYLMNHHAHMRLERWVKKMYKIKEKKRKGMGSKGENEKKKNENSEDDNQDSKVQ